MTSMSATDWDDRYRGTDLVWRATPNRWVAEETADLAPGRALDLACGEGRNSIFLAQQGWGVTGVAIAKSRRLAQAQQPPIDIDWRCADATGFDEPGSYDLAMLVYLQLPALQRRAAIRAAWQSLRPGGVLLVIAHHSDNLAAGVGGPQGSGRPVHPRRRPRRSGRLWRAAHDATG
jgi:SAM-dependent methyltransferase